MKKVTALLSVFLLVGLLLFFEASLLAESCSEPDMVMIPAGSFKMGSEEFSNAMPVHEVTLSNDFYIGKYEVTNQEFADILNYALSKDYIDKAPLAEHIEKKTVKCVSKSPQKLLDLDDSDCQIDYIKGRFKPVHGKGNFPVVEVSWYGAAFYCNILSEQEGLDKLYNLDDWTCQVYGKSGYRLPTEAEWEYVARFKDQRLYPWGRAKPDASFANYHSNVGGTVEVGRFSPKGDNALGVSDLAGNVAEWCNDWYDEYEEDSEETDPVGPPSSPLIYIPPVKRYWPLRVVRGGSWRYDPTNVEMGVPFTIDSVIHSESIQSSFRSFDYPALTRPVEGFRVVKTVVTKKTVTKTSAGQ
ncbi:MAG: SUMF1/EgtB/PvdO family nonheme iron enzyme [Deltaproteobacteria bacterium]|nr:SUMF1/EgtB/PvdO family nonheme iron enzyme [Deltaproteobacteria bacterium]